MKYLLPILLVLSGCISDKQMSEQVKKVIKEDPSILTDAIKAHPYEIMTALNQAAHDAQQQSAKDEADREKKELEKAFDSPLQPKLTEADPIRGNKDGPIVLVEYSDFQCPYCARGYTTVKSFLDKYPGKVKFVFKHMPLDFHPFAMPAAKYYEAIRMQSPEKAFQFHDKIFSNQDKLKDGEKFLDSIAKELKVDIAKAKKDMNSPEVKAKIDADIAEAQSFGIQGTPGFVLNGVPIRGAYPVTYFEEIVNKLKEKGKVQL